MIIKFKTDELYKLAVENIEKGVTTISYLPEKFITKELCEKVIQKDPHAIEWIPEKFITEKLCITALKISIHSFYYIPYKFKTKKVKKIYNDNKPKDVYY